MAAAFPDKFSRFFEQPRLAVRLKIAICRQFCNQFSKNLENSKELC
jgi:hypothetical protein